MSSFTKWPKWKCVQCEKWIVSSVKYQSRECVLSVKCVLRFEENSENLYNVFCDLKKIVKNYISSNSFYSV